MHLVQFFFVGDLNELERLPFSGFGEIGFFVNS